MGEEVIDPALPQEPGQLPDPAGNGGLPEEITFNPQDFGYQFRHETAFPKDRNDLTELMQLGRSYRENKTAWETERSQMQGLKQRYQQYDQFEAALKANPEFSQELKVLAQKYTTRPAGGNAQGQESPQFQELSQEVKAMRSWQADQELSREMTDLERNHPEYEWKKDLGGGPLTQQVLIFMRDKGLTDPDVAFRAMMFDQAKKNALMAGARSAAAAQQQQHRNGVVTNGGRPQPSKGPVDPTKMSNDQIQNAILTELGIS